MREMFVMKMKFISVMVAGILLVGCGSEDIFEDKPKEPAPYVPVPTKPVPVTPPVVELPEPGHPPVAYPPVELPVEPFAEIMDLYKTSIWYGLAATSGRAIAECPDCTTDDYQFTWFADLNNDGVFEAETEIVHVGESLEIDATTLGKVMKLTVEHPQATNQLSRYYVPAPIINHLYLDGTIFGAITNEGNATFWGFDAYDAGGTPGQVFTSVDEIRGDQWSIAMIMKDGTVLTRGLDYNGGDSSAVQERLVDVQDVIADGVWGNRAAITGSGEVVLWGPNDYSAIEDQLTNVKSIVVASALGPGWAALTFDGRVITWGEAENGGDSSAVSDKLTDVVSVLPNEGGAFAALKQNGTVVTWGQAQYGGDSSEVQDRLNNVTELFATSRAFFALKADGTVVSWGIGPGDSSSVEDKLTNIQTIVTTSGSVAALRSDGELVVWGNAFTGGDPSQTEPLTDIVSVKALSHAFIAEKSDGKKIAWGNGIGAQIESDPYNVLSLHSLYEGYDCYAVIWKDLTVSVWGQAYCSDTSAVESELYDIVDIVANIGAFTARSKDGRVMTWGSAGYAEGGNSLPIEFTPQAETEYETLP